MSRTNFLFLHYQMLLTTLVYVCWIISPQSWGLLVVDPCGGAHGGRSRRSGHLLPLHRAAPPGASTTGEPRPGQI